MKNLREKNVFITGGGSGLGKAMAERFIAEGAIVTVADRDAETRHAARALGARFIQLDVTDPVAFEAAIHEAGELDILLNNAGIGAAYTALHEADLKSWHDVIHVNLTGVFLGMKFGLARMVAQDRPGVVINTASIAGISGFPNVPAYSAAKAAVAHLTRCAAIEYGPRRIRINAIAPTVILTPLMQRSIANEADPQAALARYESFNPLPGMPEPADVAAAAAFLASDDARFITGVVLPVDGGFSAR
jgi:NAD(P)-dependent dehydrogenase (short-subunit alcohol dehydrogenase family)